ncbi:uncharacterized protein LOC100881771 [Megachile rotundata]|uniref:uncharacterized protein LOC100881771 n=1 Tax=Megachile rotundata TaxID=143995 RepID=UPI003FD605BF
MKFCYKMAKNDGLKTFHANTIQENERILHECYQKSQVENKNKEDFEKLFMKLNCICKIKSIKKESQLNSWCNKNVINYTYGPISGFPSGSWWGIRMDCSRDRVHDPFDENFQNGPFGVTSICTSSVNLNEDVDFGNYLTVTGQKYLNGKLDKDPLVKNYENQIPVRLIRSYNLLNEFAPKTGYRYDGLYIVTKFWIGVNSDSTKYYKFALLRLNNQEAPLWNTKQSVLNTIKTSSVPQSTSTFLQHCTDNPSPNMYEFKKYSHSSEPICDKGSCEKSSASSQFSHFESKNLDDKEKGVSESAIVTRHVFKKTNNNTECTSNVSSVSTVLTNNSLTHIGNQGSKTHNTNISIRTGLYNSSHSTQHDVKKCISLPFCRTSKSLNVLKTNQHIENRNLLSKDTSRNLDGKAQTVNSNEFPKRVNYVSLNTVKSEPEKIKLTKHIDTESSATENDASPNSCYQHESNNAHEELTNDTKETCKSTVNISGVPNNTLKLMNCMHRNEIAAHKIISKEVQDSKSLEFLDSLTPDEILHLINEKGHPLSELLMGNMIGLTSEQSMAFKTQNLLTAQSEVKNKITTRKNVGEIKEKKNFETISDDLIGSRCYKFRRRRRLPRKMIGKSETKKHNKIHNEKLQKSSIQPLDVLGNSLTSLHIYNHSQRNIPEEDISYLNECSNDLNNKRMKQNNLQKRKSNSLQESTKSIKKNVDSKTETKMRLQAMRSIKSSIKKHINKKQRREIANLLIDAKIGPKIRGPRNRRLRSINSTYAKQSFERFGTTMYALNKRQISSEQSTFKNRSKLTNINSYKRIKNKQTGDVKRSESNQVKIQKNLTVSKKDKDHIIEKLLNNSSTATKATTTITAPAANNNNININSKSKDVTLIQNRKRKLKQIDSEDSKFCKVEEELRSNSAKEISKPCKADAITQCSLIKEPLTKNLKSNSLNQSNVRNEQYTFIKIEYGDVKDTKPDVYEVMKLDNKTKSYNTSESGKNRTPCEETVCNIENSKSKNIKLFTNDILNAKEQSGSSPKRISAFVPVNIPDNDLKIARLRSIGFKPITCNNSDEDVNNLSKGNCSVILNNKLVKQNVTEKYNKYASEETNVVVYMDDNLQYQDIENEDKNCLSARCKASSSKNCTVKDEQLNRVALKKESYNNLLLEQDLELPWHGWKKVVTNKDTYWIGW